MAVCNLFKSLCDCGMVKNNIGDWVMTKNKKALPPNLKEELCPSCLLDVVIESNILSQKQPS